MKKRIISGIAAFVMASSMTAMVSGAQKLGDVNGENKIDIEDAVAIISHVNGLKSVGYKGSASADVNSDGKIDIEDAAVIINHINGVKTIENKDVSPAPVDMSVNKLLSTSVPELLKLSYNDFEFVQVQGQSEMYGFKCAAFPNYIFRVDQEYREGKANGAFQTPANIDPEHKHVEIYGDKIRGIELQDGASIGGGIKIGMTYNEIKEAVGGKLTIHKNNSSMGLSSTVEADGRTWEIHYDLTDEQKNEIYNRLKKAYPDGGTVSTMFGETIDISDINPVSDIATYYNDTEAWRTAYHKYIAQGEYKDLTTGLADGSTGERYKVSDENAKFALAYLDDDDIPELFVSGGMSVHVLSYKNGKIELLLTDDTFGNIGWYGNIKIVEKQGLFLDDYQRMGVYSTPVYKYSGGKVQLLSDIGYFQMPDGDKLKDQFKINGAEVSESEYLAELAKYNLNTYYTESVHTEKAIASDNWKTINTYDGHSISDIDAYIDNF